MTTPVQTAIKYLADAQLASWADHTDVAAGLTVAAGVASREMMPATAARTQKIADGIGYQPGTPVAQVLLLGKVDREMVYRLREAAAMLEKALDRDLVISQVS